MQARAQQLISISWYHAELTLIWGWGEWRYRKKQFQNPVGICPQTPPPPQDVSFTQQNPWSMEYP